MEPHLYSQSVMEHIVSKLDLQQMFFLRKHLRQPMRIASACSGSGVAELAHRALMKFGGGESVLDFSCESDKGKQRFLLGVVHARSSSSKSRSSPCCFEDIGSLCQGAAACCAHKQSCVVPRFPGVFVAGFSCKDFSRLSQKMQNDARQNILESAAGSSGGTFAGVLGYAKLARPRTILLENVDGLVKTDNCDYLWAAFGDLQYFGSYIIRNSSEFGLPQARVRVFFLCWTRASSVSRKRMRNPSPKSS